jgi:hypothetical protein
MLGAERGFVPMTWHASVEHATVSVARDARSYTGMRGTRVDRGGVGRAMRAPAGAPWHVSGIGTVSVARDAGSREAGDERRTGGDAGV